MFSFPEQKKKKKKKKKNQLLTSLLPLPNPLITGPRTFIGKGDCGPLSRPTMVGREEVILSIP